MTSFTLDVSYAQLGIFDARLSHPWNDWSEAHVAQGFAWRLGSVSFATLEASGPIVVSVSGSNASTDERIERAIRVPFSVPAHGELEIATISGSVPVQLPAGEYALTFSHGRSESGSMWATLTFDPVTAPVTAAVLLADANLKPSAELVMIAHPA